VPEDDYSRPKL